MVCINMETDSNEAPPHPDGKTIYLTSLTINYVKEPPCYFCLQAKNKKKVRGDALPIQ